MLLPLTMLLFLHGTSKPLWAGAECAPLCLRVSAAGFRALQGYSKRESPHSPFLATGPA